MTVRRSRLCSFLRRGFITHRRYDYLLYNGMTSLVRKDYWMARPLEWRQAEERPGAYGRL